MDTKRSLRDYCLSFTTFGKRILTQIRSFNRLQAFSTQICLRGRYICWEIKNVKSVHAVFITGMIIQMPARLSVQAYTDHSPCLMTIISGQEYWENSGGNMGDQGHLDHKPMRHHSLKSVLRDLKYIILHSLTPSIIIFVCPNVSLLYSECIINKCTWNIIVT